jgi:ribosomal protein S18 acetylase RimI-like enzyme
MNVTLQSIGPDDEPFLYRVYAGTRQEELAPVPWPEAQKETFLRMQFTAQHRYYQEHYPDATFSIILSDGRAAGRLYVARRPEEIRIIDIALLPAYRNAGIGTSLLEDLISESEHARKPLSIHVERFNPALRLYERLGFEKVADKGVYFLMVRPSKTE